MSIKSFFNFNTSGKIFCRNVVEIVRGMAVDEVNKYFKIWKSFCRNVVEIVGGMAVDEDCV